MFFRKTTIDINYTLQEKIELLTEADKLISEETLSRFPSKKIRALAGLMLALIAYPELEILQSRENPMTKILLSSVILLMLTLVIAETKKSEINKNTSEYFAPERERRLSEILFALQLIQPNDEKKNRLNYTATMALVTNELEKLQRLDNQQRYHPVD
jgi:hypothetical protein